MTGRHRLCGCAEMHRHSDRERIPGESGRRKRHLQLPGLIIVSQLFTDNPGKVCLSHLLKFTDF